MKRKGIIGFVIALIVVFCFAISAYADPSPKPPSDVNVVNTPLDMNVTGTPNVNVANAPDVYIANSESEPIPVTMINGSSSQRMPWQDYKLVPFMDGTSVANANFSGPASGERLTITYISAKCYITSGASIFNSYVQTSYAGKSADFSFPMSYAGSYTQSAVNYDALYGGGQFLMYQASGSNISVGFQRSDVTGDGFCEIALSGYTEPDS